MKKFDKVKKALEEKTRYSDNFITLTTNFDCRHRGKYAIKNVITNNVLNISFKTLNDVIKEYNLNI